MRIDKDIEVKGATFHWKNCCCEARRSDCHDQLVGHGGRVLYAHTQVMPFYGTSVTTWTVFIFLFFGTVEVFCSSKKTHTKSKAVQMHEDPQVMNKEEIEDLEVGFP